VSVDQIDAFTEVCQDGKEIGPGMSFQTLSQLDWAPNDQQLGPGRACGADV